MLINPFTPSEIASEPDDFFGRSEELKILERSIYQGSVAIQGAIGIGKSSLLARTRLMMEGFESDQSSKSVIAVCNRDIQTIDDISRLILASFVSIDESQKRIKFKLGSFFETESAEICKYFSEGKHLAILKRIVEKDYIHNFVGNDKLMIFAIDEADKSPIPLARFFRDIITHTQQQGVKNVRFILSGVHPFYQEMVDEDAGISRFIYRTLTLPPLHLEEAVELLEAKFSLVAKSAKNLNVDLEIDPDIVIRIAKLSGGHPHIIQLLGSHVIEHEFEDPDGIIDSKDLLNSLQKICYEDRARVYNSTIHMLDINDQLDSFLNLLHLMPKGFPSKINRQTALRNTDRDRIQWLVEHNILSTQEPEYYYLVDEFLRIRIILDKEESQTSELEKHLLRIEDGSFDEFYYDPYDY